MWQIGNPCSANAFHNSALDFGEIQYFFSVVGRVSVSLLNLWKTRTQTYFPSANKFTEKLVMLIKPVGWRESVRNWLKNVSPECGLQLGCAQCHSFQRLPWYWRETMHVGPAVECTLSFFILFLLFSLLWLWI